ncbi:hypothetical protein CS371_27305 (plasmid) [Serratia marcescens]|nr:hypothetical protein BVG94_13720 [Serratia marcescens]PIJ26707.1 hypothetical protein BVV03_00260 [Serratia sp. OSPLW9]PIJ31328.1 hypothetical protein BOM26_18720 [Serratia sp. OPWLW3]PIJ47632.1 hypothetical protein BOM25_00260 [Serratia sp. OPWLW2]ASM03216.1 hypothetical protein BVG88_14010 [Serratia marcescens]
MLLFSLEVLNDESRYLKNAKRNEPSPHLLHRQSVTVENVRERTFLSDSVLIRLKPGTNASEITGTNRGLRVFFRSFLYEFVM